MKELETILGNIRQNLIEGQTQQLKESVQGALNKGVAAEEILNQGLISGMEVLGQQFEKKEAYVPDLLLAARAMMAVMEILEPQLVKAKAQAIKAKVVIGTVQGDMHNIGKNLVIIMLKGAGLEVTDLGIDVPPQEFVDAAKEGTKLVCMSALLATSLPFMKTTIEALHEAGLGEVKTMVGGATVTRAYAQSIGADGYAPNAAAAANKAKELLNLT
ncbi:cobalamin-dependent protein [Chloroflexota bacterium]